MTGSSNFDCSSKYRILEQNYMDSTVEISNRLVSAANLSETATVSMALTRSESNLDIFARIEKRKPRPMLRSKNGKLPAL